MESGFKYTDIAKSSIQNQIRDDISILASSEDVVAVSDKIGPTEDTSTTTLFGKINSLITKCADIIAIKEKTDTIGATGDTGGSSTAGSVMAKLNNLRSYVVTNNTANKTGVLSAKLSYIINKVEALGGVSTTGTGTTVYSSSAAISHTANSDLGWITCIGKFIAPKSGIYNVTIRIKSFSSGDPIEFYKYISRDTVESSSSTQKRCDISETYLNTTVGSGLSGGLYWSTNSWSSSGTHYAFSIEIGSIAKSTTSGTFSFFAEAGEPVILSCHHTSSKTINSVTVTCS